MLENDTMTGTECAQQFLDELMQRIRKSQEVRRANAKELWEKADKKRGDKRQEAITKALYKNPDCIAFFPRESLTQEICLLAVQKSPLSISFIPEEFRTEKLSKIAVVQATNGTGGPWSTDMLAELVLECKQTVAVCKLVAQGIMRTRPSGALYGVLGMVKDQTEDICKGVITYLPWEIFFVRPENMKPYYIDISLASSCGNSIQMMDKTEALCRRAVEVKGSTLQYITDYIFDKKNHVDAESICFAAVKKDGIAIQFVPKEKRSEQMCLTAVKSHPSALQYVPDDVLSTSFLDMVVDIYQDRPANESMTYVHGVVKPLAAYLLTDMQEKLSGKAFRYCISKIDHALSLISEEGITEEYCYLALQHSFREIAHIPGKFYTADICTAFLKGYAEDIKKRKNVDMRIAVPTFRKAARPALEKDGLLLSVCPDYCISPALAKVAVKQNADALQYVPVEVQTEDIQLLAVRKKPAIMQSIKSPSDAVIEAMLKSPTESSFVLPLATGKSGQEVYDILEELGMMPETL